MFNWLSRLSIEDDVYLLLLLLTVLIMLIRYNYLSYNIKPLFLFAYTHFALELLSDYVHYGMNKINLILYHAFAPTSYFILLIFFFRTFTDNTDKRNVLISFILYLLLVVMYTVLWEPFNQFNSLAYMTESIFVIYWCFVYFKRILLKEYSYRPEKDRTFWYVIAILFYYTGSFFTVGSLSFFTKKFLRYGFSSLGSQIYYAGYAFNYLFYITLCVITLINFSSNRHEQLS